LLSNKFYELYVLLPENMEEGYTMSLETFVECLDGAYNTGVNRFRSHQIKFRHCLTDILFWEMEHYLKPVMFDPLFEIEDWSLHACKMERTLLAISHGDYKLRPPPVMSVFC
jgi:hypothetical protein